MPCHCPAPAPPDGLSDPGFHSPKAPESGGSSPQAPQRHTGRHLWSLHWPLYKGKRVTKIYEISEKTGGALSKVLPKKKNLCTSAFKSKTELNIFFFFFYNIVKLMIEILKYPCVDEHDI